jgi:hypothetical protein
MGTGARWGLNPYPQQRVVGLGLVIVSALVLIVLLAAKIRCWFAGADVHGLQVAA